jgi:hypothetical protein
MISLIIIIYIHLYALEQLRTGGKDRELESTLLGSNLSLGDGSIDAIPVRNLCRQGPHSSPHNRVSLCDWCATLC